MPRFLTVIWNPGPGGNLDKIAQHGLTPEEVEDVLLNPRLRPFVSRASGSPAVKGFTRSGRHIVVPYLEIDEDTAYPITAFEID